MIIELFIMKNAFPLLNKLRAVVKFLYLPLLLIQANLSTNILTYTYTSTYILLCLYHKQPNKHSDSLIERLNIFPPCNDVKFYKHIFVYFTYFISPLKFTQFSNNSFNFVYYSFFLFCFISSLL